jgi:hypothetical protein
LANFIMLARGESVRTARILAVSADQVLIERFIRELAGKDDKADESEDPWPLPIIRGDGE